MEFHIKTDITPLKPRLCHSDKLMVMGSCFATHIGSRLQQMKWQVEVNPFGVLYNPLSIAEALRRLINQRLFAEGELCEFPDGGWNTWLHHSSYSHSDKRAALTSINESLMSASLLLAEASTLIITLGTAWVFRLKEGDIVVGNCHKMPDRIFVRQCLAIEEIVAEYKALFEQLWHVNPKLRILFTVSPVRHLKDGLHGNQLSKSTLLLAVDELCRQFPERLHYFPAYEIVVDELRDYRFYAEDMAHPSAQAINYVWEEFVDYCVDPEAQKFMEQWDKISRALGHRPFNSGSEQYRQFVLQTILKVDALKEQYPYIDIENERARLIHLGFK